MRKLASAFSYAINGILLFFAKERNGKIQLVSALATIVLGIVCSIDRYEWLWVIFCIALVFCAEMFNTVVEKIADFVEPNKNDQIKIIKDIAAGAVLIPAIASLLIGLIIFLPKIISFITT